MGDVRRPPPFRFFLQLYRGEGAFQAMVDFAVLGALTIAFVEPQLLSHPFSSKGSVTPPQQQAVVSPAPTAPPPSAAPPQAPAAKSEVATPSSSSSPSTTPKEPSDPTSTADIGKAVANLKKLPAWAAVPVTPVDTPGLHNVPIPFTNFVTGAMHPPSRFVRVDERPFANLPYQLRETVKAALAARADQDADRMRAVLKDVDSAEGTPELLLGLSYLINGTPGSGEPAEKSYRIALQKGQPQAPMLLGLLLTSREKGLTGTSAEGKALIESVLANDRAAWLLTGNGYLNGESGTLDPAKAAPWIIKAAEAGEPLAFLQYARLAENGIGMEKNISLAEGALRRAADLGLTEAEDILGRWILNAYQKKFIEDPTEGIKLEERAVAKRMITSTNLLGVFYTVNARAPWKDEARGAKLLRECAAFKFASCQNNFSAALLGGRGIERDIVAAWAHYDVGRQLQKDGMMPGLVRMDETMTPTEKEDARKQSRELMAGLKDMPRVIVLRRDP